MSRTHRAHLSDTALAKRGGKQGREERETRREKSQKQRRVNERAKLRKEYR